MLWGQLRTISLLDEGGYKIQNAILCMWNIVTEMPRGERLESKVDEQTKMMVRRELSSELVRFFVFYDFSWQ